MQNSSNSGSNSTKKPRSGLIASTLIKCWMPGTSRSSRWNPLWPPFLSLPAYLKSMSLTISS
uniref:Alternative protein DNAH9 n=1 Tax=Homo sapiens TaxID=9606 RepID=L8E799_HUMAN|nr:alternative protein DNAH9 [Homo sapiens]